MNILSLEKRINKLCSQLKSSGKVDPANYYEKLVLQIKKTSNNKTRKDALQEIITSGKLANLANFDYQEDQLFDLVYEEAKRLRNENR